MVPTESIHVLERDFFGETADHPVTMRATVHTTSRNPPELPAAVSLVLHKIEDENFRDRLHRVLTVAAHAIARLRDLDLSRAEELAGSGLGSDLALWEEVAPAVAASIADVNALLSAVQEQMPPPAARDEEDDLDLAFGSSDTARTTPGTNIPTTPSERADAAIRAIHAISEALRYEVGRFGTRVRNPAVVADRWNLMVDLQEFRGKCRAAIGELVYSSCNAFADVSRPSVVPAYDADLEEALDVRRAWSTLTRATGPLNARLQSTAAEQQRPLLLAVQRELEHFRASRGYLMMRAGDKRFVIAFARDLKSLVDQRQHGTVARQLVEGFAKFLDSMAVINRREVLGNHDREAFAECGMLLEQARLHLDEQEPRLALARLIQAQKAASRLFGRDRHLDDYLVLRLRWPVEQLADDALPAAIEELRQCLAESGTHTPGTLF